MRSWRGDKLGDLGFVGIAHHVGYAGESGEFFGSALSVAAGDDNFGGGIGGVEFADGGAGLRVVGGGQGAGVQGDYVGGVWGVCKRAAAFEELRLDGGTVGLGGAVTQFLDGKAGQRSNKLTRSG